MHPSRPLVLFTLSLLALATPTPDAPISHGVAKGVHLDDSAINDISRSVARNQNTNTEYRNTTGVTQPIDETRTLDKRDDTIKLSIPLTYRPNVGWSCDLHIGPEKEPFKMLIAMSGYVMVPLPSCRKNCEEHKSYNPDDSSAMGPFDLEDKSVTGVGYFDTVQLGGTLEVPNQAVVGALEYPEHHKKKKFPPDGILGFGFPPGGSSIKSSFIDNLVNQNRDINCFTLRTANTGASGPVLEIGKFDIKSPMTRKWLQVPEVFRSWATYFTHVKVSGETTVVERGAHLDPGNIAIIGDLWGINEIFKRILTNYEKRNGFYYVPCDFNAEISIIITGGLEIKIPPEALSLGKDSHAPKDSASPCFAAIQASPDPVFKTIWTLGAPVFKGADFTFAYNGPTGIRMIGIQL